MKWRKFVMTIGGMAMLVGGLSAIYADETVSIGESNAVFLAPSTPTASIILMPGGNGIISPGPNGAINSLTGNQLVRTRNAYVARGLAVLVVDAGVDLAKAVQYMAQIKKPVTVAATSRGTLRAAEGIARGARPDALVLTSGFLTNESGNPANVSSILGSHSLLPPTLILHHRNDGCKFTKPAGVAPFIEWAAGRANVIWLSGGISTGNPCEAHAYHGFNGLDDEVVSLAATFHPSH